MKFDFYFQKAALHIAIEEENVEIIQLLLSNKDIDVNLAQILKYFLF